MVGELTDSGLRLALGYAAPNLPAGALPVSYMREAIIADLPISARFYAAVIDSKYLGFLIPSSDRHDTTEITFANHLTRKPKVVKKMLMNMQKRGVKDPYGHGDPVSAFSR